MHLPLKFVFEHTPEGVFLNVFGEGTHDRIPVDVMSSQTFEAVLSTAPEATGPSPPSRAMQKKARKNEHKIAEDIGGRAQPNSGAVPGMKGDVRKKGELRVEAKTTTSMQYIITRRLLNKIRSECGLGEKPAFVIVFANKLTLKEEDTWVLLPYEDWNATHNNR